MSHIITTRGTKTIYCIVDGPVNDSKNIPTLVIRFLPRGNGNSDRFIKFDRHGAHTRYVALRVRNKSRVFVDPAAEV